VDREAPAFAKVELLSKICWPGIGDYRAVFYLA